MDRRFAPWGWHTQWHGDGTRSGFETFRLWAAQHANGDDPWKDAYAIALAMAELYRREIEQLKENRDRLEQAILDAKEDTILEAKWRGSR